MSPLLPGSLSFSSAFVFNARKEEENIHLNQEICVNIQSSFQLLCYYMITKAGSLHPHRDKKER